MFLPDRKRGVTIVEIIIVVSITLILAAAAAPIYGNLQVSGQLNENAAQITQTVRTARGRSISRFHNAAHGVYFEKRSAPEKDRYTLYQGPSYAGRDAAYDRVVELARALTLSLPGEATTYDIHFSQGLGNPTNYGTITLTHDAVGSREIIINEFGVVEDRAP
jgi:prepilin-type N-terminal cleavage/methylation domain-containing protein